MWSITKTISKLVPNSLAPNEVISSRFINECIINKSKPETEKEYLELIGNFSAPELVTLSNTVITEGKWSGYSVMGKLIAEDDEDESIVSAPDKTQTRTDGKPTNNLKLVNRLMFGLSDQQRQEVYTFKQGDGRTPASMAMKNAKLNGHLHRLIKVQHLKQSTELLNFELLKIALINGYGDFLYYAFNNFQNARETEQGATNSLNAFDLFLDNFSKIKIWPILDNYSKLKLWPINVTWMDKLAFLNIDNSQWESENSRPYKNSIVRMTLLEATIINRKNDIITFFLSGTNINQRKAIYNLRVQTPEFAGENILTLALAFNEPTFIKYMLEDLTETERIEIARPSPLKTIDYVPASSAGKSSSETNAVLPPPVITNRKGFKRNDQ